MYAKKGELLFDFNCHLSVLAVNPGENVPNHPNTAGTVESFPGSLFYH